MADHDVHDSTDWLSTPLAALAAVEGALRCQVCKDFFKTPMITTCSHTFCSICIRRALSNEGKCPLCRAPEQEVKLRSNWSVEEAVEAFTKARPATLDLARNHDTKRTPSKRKAVENHHESGDAPEGKRLRSSSRIRSTRQTPSYTIPKEEDDIAEVPDDDDDFQPEPEDGLVACPVCQSRMKEWQVFKHLETCTGPTPKLHRTLPSSSSSSFGQQRQHAPTPDRLPAINYSMYKDQALRKKMSDLGISNQGPRALLERRHREWMTIWNSNCDATQPRKQRELLKDLETWEKTQGGRAPTTGRSVQNAALIKDKDFDGAAWAAKHDESFKDLIDQARKTRLEARRKAEEAAKEAETEETTTTLPQAFSTVDQPESTWTTPIPNGHFQAPPTPQYVVSYDNNIDLNKQQLYPHADGLSQTPALNPSWPQNTESKS
ncbi:e3 ubiquitin ligase rad18 [Fusarium heterosporum]|uniref:Postreplication repair E3 ubiquitin-protein ligase RAD18 n=1 Tax=Fusarium heterosporum TaxID=42747 RepID=A0A8H5WKV1_FUSHE|nr:e3 ubiquitin ligase rad18 [Fusarium heterosporum]